MKRLVGVFALSIAICAFGGQAIAACNQNKLNKKIGSFNKQCDRVRNIVDVMIPAADSLMAQDISLADSKMEQAINVARQKEDAAVNKLLTKSATYAANQAEALVTCALNLDFTCNAAIALGNKIANIAIKINQVHDKADQKVAQITTSRNSKVAKITSKHEKSVTALQTKQSSFTAKANGFEHAAVLLPECNVVADTAPFLCDPHF